MLNKRFFISGTNYQTGKRIAIMRNDIEDILCNGRLMFFHFKGREKLAIRMDGYQIFIDTDGLFFLNRYYKEHIGSTEHAYTLKFNRQEL